MTGAISATTKSMQAPTLVAKQAEVKQGDNGHIAVPTASAKVTISAAGQSASQAASQEAAETPAQSAQEAQHGDRQAQKLVARQAATQALFNAVKS
jgi:hypothetical protein